MAGARVGGEPPGRGAAGDRGACSLPCVACVPPWLLLETLVLPGNPRVFRAGETDGRLQEGSWQEPGRQQRLSCTRRLCFVCCDCFDLEGIRGRHETTSRFSARGSDSGSLGVRLQAAQPAVVGAWFSGLPLLRRAADRCVCGCVVSCVDGAGWSQLGPRFRARSRYSLSDSRGHEATSCGGSGQLCSGQLEKAQAQELSQGQSDVP